MIDAAEIRSLCNRSAVEEVDEVLELLKKSVYKNPDMPHSFRCRDKFWVNEGYSKTPKWNDAKKILEDRGFKVEFYYEEFSIAVDMYTIISW